MTQPEQIKEKEEMSSPNGNTGAFVLGTLFGGLIAATAMLLLAPQSGAETQELIRSKASDLKAEAEKSILNKRHAVGKSIYTGFNDVLGKLEQIAATLHEQVEEMKETS